MQQHKTIQLVPAGQFSIKDLDKFLFELELRFKQKEVMHRKEAAAFIGVNVRTLDRSNIPYHTVEGLSGKLYLRSEMLEHIKNSPKE